MGVKRVPSKPAGPTKAEQAQADHEKSQKAKRHARIILGSPPPSQAFTPKRQKPPKHKKPPGAEEV
ncbi:MAG: hypothetical protein IH602_13715 [Bryobacteraceae bacterium]|jgi:hypothetical protein|nr:hypothetical protein [Bryobacteraceae bacterium]